MGKRLQNLRTSRGWTQPKLAKKARVSRAYVSELENAKRPRPGFITLGRVAAALGVPLSQLTGIDSRDLDQLVEAKVDEVMERRERDQLRPEFGGAVVPRQSRDDTARHHVYDGVAAALKLTDLAADPDSIGEAEPPGRYRNKLHPDAFALRVRGRSMVGYTDPDGEPCPIRPGDLVWINPQAETDTAGLVVAVVSPTGGGDPQAVVKYHDGNGQLYSEPLAGKRELLDGVDVATMTPVVAVTSEWGPP